MTEKPGKPAAPAEGGWTSPASAQAVAAAEEELDPAACADPAAAAAAFEEFTARVAAFYDALNEIDRGTCSPLAEEGCWDVHDPSGWIAAGPPDPGPRGWGGIMWRALQRFAECGALRRLVAAERERADKIDDSREELGSRLEKVCSAIATLQRAVAGE